MPRHRTDYNEHDIRFTLTRENALKKSKTKQEKKNGSCLPEDLADNKKTSKTIGTTTCKRAETNNKNLGK